MKLVFGNKDLFGEFTSHLDNKDFINFVQWISSIRIPKIAANALSELGKRNLLLPPDMCPRCNNATHCNNCCSDCGVCENCIYFCGILCQNCLFKRRCYFCQNMFTSECTQCGLKQCDECYYLKTCKICNKCDHMGHIDENNNVCKECFRKFKCEMLPGEDNCRNLYTSACINCGFKQCDNCYYLKTCKKCGRCGHLVAIDKKNGTCETCTVWDNHKCKVYDDRVDQIIFYCSGCLENFCDKCHDDGSIECGKCGNYLRDFASQGYP